MNEYGNTAANLLRVRVWRAGVFFLYDLSPIKVRFEEKQRSFASFLTGICAIIGGVYTVSGILDSFIFVSVRSIKKKIQMGKHS